MVETVVSASLPVHENLIIQKNRILPKPGNDTGKRVCIVTGTHGDELEGQYVCCLLNQLLLDNLPLLRGTVDIYPALNPLGVNTITRGIPMFDLDMNRIFPGGDNGPTAEYVAKAVYDDLLGADLCIDIHASNIYLREIPQVRINELNKDELVPLAKHLGIDFIWVHSSATVLESTLAYSLNTAGTKTLVVEMGVGMRITQNYGDQLTGGILNLMREIGIYAGKTKPVRKPLVSSDEQVHFINANSSGLFLPTAGHGGIVQQGDSIGSIVDPLTGRVLELLKSPCDGMIFTLREYPVVYNGSLIARVQGGVPA